MNIIKNNSGAIVLIIVVLISAVAFLMAYSATLLGLGDLEISDSYEQGTATLMIVDGCAEETLYQLHLDNDYSGGGLVIGEGSCIIEVVDPPGLIDRQINIHGILGHSNKKIQIDVDLVDGEPVVLNWQDLSL